MSEIRLEAEALPSPPEAGAGEGRAGGGAPSGVVGGVVSRPAETSSRAAAPRLAPPPPKREVARERKGEAPEHEARLAQRFRAKAAPAPGGPPKAAAVPGVAQPPSDAFADKGGPAEESAAFIRLAAEHPEAAEDWRRLRQAWRELAPTLGSRELADEARVRGLEAAAGAFRTSGEAQDAAVLQSDAAEYFSRADALQSDRVRRLLRQVLP